MTNDYHGSHFFVRQEGVLSLTPLFLVLLVVESMDVVFAVDSIPAIFAVTRDPFAYSRRTSSRSWGCVPCTLFSPP